MEDNVSLNVVMVELFKEHKHVMMEIKILVTDVLQPVKFKQTIDVLENLQFVKVLHQPQLLLIVEMGKLIQMKNVMMVIQIVEMDVLVYAG